MFGREDFGLYGFSVVGVVFRGVVDDGYGYRFFSPGY